MSVDANGPISHMRTLARAQPPLTLAPNPRHIEPNRSFAILAVADKRFMDWLEAQNMLACGCKNHGTQGGVQLASQPLRRSMDPSCAVKSTTTLTTAFLSLSHPSPYY